MILIILLIVWWLIIGAMGFIYWWTREFDLTSNEIIFVIMASFLGPISWIFGYDIHGKKTLIKKRDKNDKN